MDIASKLPSMTNAEVATLLGNTKRLIDAGTPAQKSAAATLMPSITAEQAARDTAATAKRAEALATRRADKMKLNTTAAG
jgi:hypothetical protein